MLAKVSDLIPQPPLFQLEHLAGLKAIYRRDLTNFVQSQAHGVKIANLIWEEFRSQLFGYDIGNEEFWYGSDELRKSVLSPRFNGFVSMIGHSAPADLPFDAWHYVPDTHKYYGMTGDFIAHVSRFPLGHSLYIVDMVLIDDPDNGIQVVLFN